MSSKGPPLFFGCFGSNRKDVKKSLKVPPFFGTMRLFKIMIFCLIFGFLNNHPPIIFFNTIQILKVGLRKYCGLSEFLTLNPNYLVFREEGEGGRGPKTSAPICPSMLYPNFGRFIRKHLRFTEEL